jgi:peptidoglycan hydrolase-like protein with peptidoglycan-binding domain
MPNKTLSLGTTGAAVEQLHSRLQELGFELPASDLDHGRFGQATQMAVRKIQRDNGLPISGKLTAKTAAVLATLSPPSPAPVMGDPSPAPTNQQGRVEGSLVDQDGAGIAGAVIALFSQGLRTRSQIGKATTDPLGAFGIVYARPGPLNLQVQASTTGAAVVAKSAVVFSAPADVQIDLTTAPDGVVRTPSAYTVLVAGVNAQLQGTALSALKQDKDNQDLAFVASAAGAAFDDVAKLYISVRLAATSKLNSATLYGIFSQGIPAPLAAGLASLPDAGIDDAFAGQVLAGVLAHSSATLSAALTSAVAANVLPASYAAQQAAELARLDAMRVQSIGAAPYVRGKTPLNDLLAAGNVDTAARTAFTQAYAATGGRLGPTWKTLRADKTLTKAQLATLNTTLSLGELLGGNLPLVKDSMQRMATGSLVSVQTLAMLDQADWVARMTQIDPQATTIPPVLPDDTPAQRIARFAKAVAERFASRYPTTALAGGLSKAQTSSFASKDELAAVLTANPKLNLKRTNIDQFVLTHKLQLSDAALSDLKAVQRLHRLSPHYATVEALNAAGYRSAQSVYFKGRAPFVAQMTPLLGSAPLAEAAWVRAQAGYAGALSTYARFNLALNSPTFALMASPVPEANSVAGLPDLNTLFGSLDECECSDCRSVVSPAAYLVDLLHFLGKRTASGGFTTARDVLFARRADLQFIALDCANTDVTLPYIDVVNELFEAAIVPPATPVTLIETTGTAAERRALPQQVSADAYIKTAAAVFPLTLPFDLPFAQTAAFLTAMGSSLDQAMSLCASGTPAAGAAARLGLNPAMQAVINGTDGHQSWERWGFDTAHPATVIDPKTRLPMVDPDTQAVFVPKDWVDALSRVPVLLGRADLSFAQVCQLLEMVWVTASGGTLNLGVVEVSGAQVVSCDTERMTLTGLDADAFDRVSRFLRLLSATGLQMWELDWALQAAGGSMDDGFLVFLADALALRDRLGLPLQELLAFWGPLPTRDVVNHLGAADTVVPSTYSAVFGNPTVLASWSTVFVDPGSLSGAALDPSAIKAALGLSADDIAAILAAAGAADTLSLDTLNQLLRHERLASALSLSVADLLRWIALTDRKPFDGAPSDTAEFLRRLAVLQGTGIQLNDLDYLLRNAAIADSALALTATQTTAMLQTVRDALAKLSPAAQADAPTVATIFVDALVTATATSANVVAPVLAKTAILPLEPATIALLLAQTAGVDPGLFPTLITALTQVSKASVLFNALRLTEPEFPFLVQNASSLNALDPSALPLTTPANSPYPAFESLLRAVALNHRQSGRTPKLFDVLSEWIAAPPPDLASAISGGEGAFASALNASVTDVTALTAALGAAKPSFGAGTQSGSLADMALLSQMATALDAMSKYRVGAAALIQLATAPPNADSANVAMGACQSQYTPAAWFGAVQPVEDKLRSARRDALVAYLIGPGPATAVAPPMLGSADIFEQYLIDPEMCACGITTRLLEASLAVQQFVQQCFLGLVPQVAVDATADSGWNQWPCMSQFRLWQANRQVFLYPENYLLPELRTDKSPFFVDLENDLKQGNCDADATTAAFENYLRKLVAVRNLVVAAHYCETRADGSQVLHVFARTRDTAPQWYYRTREEASIGAGLWSAWQPLNLGIGSEQVVPVVWDQRLHLIWPVFKLISEKTTEQKIPAIGSLPQNQALPRKFWAIEFAMSELSAGEWQPKRTYAEKCFIAWPDSTLQFTFRAVQDPQFNLRLEVYYMKDLAAIALLPMPDSPLAVFESSWSGLPDPLLVDITQEPSIAHVNPLGEIGSLPTPSIYHVFSGQDMTCFGPGAGTIHPLTLLAASGKNLVTLEVLGQIDNQRVVLPIQEPVSDSADPFFVADPARTFFVQPSYYTVSSSPQELDNLDYIAQWATRYAFEPFYHPFARTFLRELEIGGIDRLMRRNLQIDPQVVRAQGSYDFAALYQPQQAVMQPYPFEEVDFSVGGAYALYNWEAFYHAPMFIASQLMRNQQYPDAMQWLQYIFDPTDASLSPVPGHFWQTRPFYEMNASVWLAQQIQTLLSTLAASAQQHISDPDTTAAIVDWLAHPFDPHRVARLRIGAYAKSTVMKFLDNLIAWGDSLYAQYTMEMVAQAEQLYVFADLILGPQPERVRLPDIDLVIQPEKTSYATIADGLDAFSNELVAVENLIAAPVTPLQTTNVVAQAPDLPQLSTQFFCIPANDQLLTYWSTVADRLYKIRHCLNLQGVAQPLPLYAPPINTLQLIEQGVGNRVAGIAAPAFTPVYRLPVYLERALELTNDVRGYGSLVLAALEKKDAEALALLRANQDVDIQTRLLDIKTQSVTEAQDQIMALQNQKVVVQVRHDFYSSIAFMNDWETTAIALMTQAQARTGNAIWMDFSAATLHLLPNFAVGAAGVGGTPYSIVKFGGQQLASAAESWAGYFHGLANMHAQSSGKASTIAGYQRRMDEWTLQANLAAGELTQLDSQIAAASDRLAIANGEVELQNRQISNAQAVSDFLTSKYTNAQLYDWMLTQLTTTHTQAYQLAFALAQQAEATYQYELGNQDSFVQFGYWDSQHKGLTAGESLLFDLRRMQAQFLTANTREIELVKHVSLALTQPMALVMLLQTGTCSVALDETLYDLDHPGQYFRRLRSVALTVPCVTGPYTGVNASLSLNSATVRVQPPTAPYQPMSATSPPTGPAFVTSPAPSTATISTSHGQNDAGLFDVNLRDERWLPFEGQGAVSTWTLVLDPRDNAFDLSTITDVVLHLRYTARAAGGDPEAVRQALKPSGSRQIMLSTRSSFGDAYYAFFNPSDTTASLQSLALLLTADVLPFSNLGFPEITDIAVYFVLDVAPAAGTVIPATLGPTGGPASPLSIAQVPGNTAGGTPIAALGADAGLTTPSPAQSFTLTVPEASVPAALGTTSNGHLRLDATKFQDIVLIVSYKIV